LSTDVDVVRENLAGQIGRDEDAPARVIVPLLHRAAQTGELSLV
jgi:hypothetical protein